MWEKLIWLRLGIMDKIVLKSSGMWDFVFEWMVPDVSKRDIAFVFKGQALFLLDCLTLEGEGHVTFRNVGTTLHPKDLKFSASLSSEFF